MRYLKKKVFTLIVLWVEAPMAVFCVTGALDHVGTSGCGSKFRFLERIRTEHIEQDYREENSEHLLSIRSVQTRYTLKDIRPNNWKYWSDGH